MPHLREIRKDLGLSQVEWAKLFLISGNSLAIWERGTSAPTGAQKARTETVAEICAHPELYALIKYKLQTGNGMPAVAALIGVVDGVKGVTGMDLHTLHPLLHIDSEVMSLIKSLSIKDNAYV